MTEHGWARRATSAAAVLAVVLAGALNTWANSGDAWTHGAPRSVDTIQPVPEVAVPPPPAGPAAVDAARSDLEGYGR